MNYAFLETMDRTGLQKFRNYIKDSLYRARKFGWCKAMIPVWQDGDRKANNLLKHMPVAP